MNFYYFKKGNIYTGKAVFVYAENEEKMREYLGEVFPWVTPETHSDFMVLGEEGAIRFMEMHDLIIKQGWTTSPHSLLMGSLES